MRILLTGAAGFIGYYVAQRLLDGGERVVGMDEVNDAYDPRLKEWRLNRLRGHEGFEFVRGSVCDRTAVEELFHRHRFDAIINLAARAGVRQSVRDPWVYYETNVTGTLNLLEACRVHGVRKFVLASTSSVYGAPLVGPLEHPFCEDAVTDAPLSPYAASKKAAEVLCHTYHYLHGLDVSVLRYFTVYGPAGRPDMSIFRFIRWITEGEPVVVYGDGRQRRDFTYVGDVAEGTVRALRPIGYEVVNLGSDRPVALLELIELLEEITGKEARIVREASQPADVPATWADISKARRLLGWEPRTTLKDGLKDAVQWYVENRDWAREVRLT